MRTIMSAVSLQALMILIALIAIGSGSRNESVTFTITSVMEPENPLEDAGEEKRRRRDADITPGKREGICGFNYFLQRAIAIITNKQTHIHINI